MSCLFISFPARRPSKLLLKTAAGQQLWVGKTGGFVMDSQVLSITFSTAPFLEFCMSGNFFEERRLPRRSKWVRGPKCVTLELKFSILQDDWFHYVQPGTRRKWQKKKESKKDATFVSAQISCYGVYSEAFFLVTFPDASLLFICVQMRHEQSRSESVALS